MPGPFPVARLRFATTADALGALRAVGARHAPALDLEVEHPDLGLVRRHFGVIGNLLQDRPEDPVIARRWSPLVTAPDNETVLGRLARGLLEHAPMNKQTIVSLLPELHDRGLHLPFAFRPMNADLAARLRVADAARPFGFHAYYSQAFKLAPDGAALLPGRVFSQPVRGAGAGTFQEPISHDLLDEDVGLILEADTR
jgi:hypothetical protein